MSVDAKFGGELYGATNGNGPQSHYGAQAQHNLSVSSQSVSEMLDGVQNDTRSNGDARSNGASSCQNANQNDRNCAQGNSAHYAMAPGVPPGADGQFGSMQNGPAYFVPNGPPFNGRYAPVNGLPGGLMPNGGAPGLGGVPMGANGMPFANGLPGRPPKPGLNGQHLAHLASECQFRVHELNRRLQAHEPDSRWWASFANEFFDAEATLSVSVNLDDGPPHRFSIGRTLIARYFRSVFDSNVLELYFVLNGVRELFLPGSDGPHPGSGAGNGGPGREGVESIPARIVIDAPNAQSVTQFGKPTWVCAIAEGRWSLEFCNSPPDEPQSLRIRNWSFEVRRVSELVPRSLLALRLREPFAVSREHLLRNVTRGGLSQHTLNFLRLCVILEPMQTLMVREKLTGTAPRDTLKTLVQNGPPRNGLQPAGMNGPLGGPMEDQGMPGAPRWAVQLGHNMPGMPFGIGPGGMPMGPAAAMMAQAGRPLSRQSVHSQAQQPTPFSHDADPQGAPPAAAPQASPAKGKRGARKRKGAQADDAATQPQTSAAAAEGDAPDAPAAPPAPRKYTRRKDKQDTTATTSATTTTTTTATASGGQPEPTTSGGRKRKGKQQQADAAANANAAQPQANIMAGRPSPGYYAGMGMIGGPGPGPGPAGMQMGGPGMMGVGPGGPPFGGQTMMGGPPFGGPGGQSMMSQMMGGPPNPAMMGGMMVGPGGVMLQPGTMMPGRGGEMDPSSFQNAGEFGMPQFAGGQRSGVPPEFGGFAPHPNFYQ